MQQRSTIAPNSFDALIPETARVTSVRKETVDTFTMDLDRGFRFEPGQFNMLYAFGAGEVPISISGDPADSSRLVHTIRSVGAVTKRLEALRPGDMLGVRGPYGEGWPMAKARGHDIVIVAGGIGLAPLRPVIYHALRHRDDYGNVVLLYGARSPEDMIFESELHRWRGRFDMGVKVIVDRAPSSWRTHVGVVTTLIPKVYFDPIDTIAMVCGPEVMMRFVVREFQNRGLTEDKIYVSMERNMKCAVGLCGHCQFGPEFICADGPVFRYDRVRDIIGIREI
ncbi:MAG: FAD/NAD(P)-binding protein [Planctomycetes bacterium]|nr:FAD/NAD(P)-binding protein [Planctomycetota bacterium]